MYFLIFESASYCLVMQLAWHVFTWLIINCYIWFILNCPEIIMTIRLWGGFWYRKSTARIGQTEGSWMNRAVGTSSETSDFLSITSVSKLYGERLSKLHFCHKQAVGGRQLGLLTSSDYHQTGEFVSVRSTQKPRAWDSYATLGPQWTDNWKYGIV